MMCDCCQHPMKPEESKQYEMPGATGPGTTINVHKKPCSMAASSRPAPYPYDRRY